MTDKKMAYPQGLSPHGNSWRITKRIPTELLPHYGGKTQLRHNTGKADKREAASVAWQWHAEQEAEFERLRTTGRREKTSIAPADIQWLVNSMLSYALGAHEEALASGSAPAGRKSREANRAARYAAHPSGFRIMHLLGEPQRMRLLAVLSVLLHNRPAYS
jgi:hypothetical protein